VNPISFLGKPGLGKAPDGDPRGNLEQSIKHKYPLKEFTIRIT